MLRSLDIRDMLIIDRMQLEFRPGLNVLTGETGAGKSILLDALGFVLGWRGPAGLTRNGAAQGEVTAVFDLSDSDGHPVQAQLAELGVPAEGELIFRRVNSADGRKTAWVNDRRVSGEVLRSLSGHLVELHGQHDDRGLLNPRGHRRLLDEFAGLSSQLPDVRISWRQVSQAQDALDAAGIRQEAARSEEGFLRHAVAELDTLAAEPGEDESLGAKRRLMQAAGRVREDIARAAQILGSDGAEGMTTDALRWLEGADDAAGDLLAETIEALGRALNELAEARQGVERCLDSLSFDTAELEMVEERLFAIRALARKHGVPPDELSTFSDELRARLEAIGDGADHLSRLETDLAAAREQYRARSHDLSAMRKSAAVRLGAAMASELPPLKMERAIFAVEIAPAEPGPEGIDGVAFTVTANPGAPGGHLNRIASGGELSRFLLALKVCLSAGNGGVTMIFDEIDRGVGGATADAVGRRLKALADGAQVLVVTHSPQVAALAAHHWQVSKRIEAGRTLSVVTPLDANMRVDELARMLSGDTVTPQARAAAAALLQG